MTAINGRSGAGPPSAHARWIMRASSSLPVPLSPDEHGGRERSDLVHDLDHVLHGAAGSDDELAVADVLHFVAQGDEPPIQVLPLGGVRDGGPQRVGSVFSRK